MITVVNPSKTPGSIITIQFNFISELINGASISGATLDVEVLSGVDASPAAILDGSYTTSGGIVFQKLTGGVPGVIYQVTCFATLSNGNLPAIQTKIAIV